MSLADQLQEARGGPPSILEASLSRVWQHHGETGFVIMTSWRGDEDAKTNKANLKTLKGLVKGAGYGFIPVEGVGQEKVGGKVVQASEPSLLIPAKKKGDNESDVGQLRELAMKWGKKFNQFAVLVHDPEGGTQIVTPTGKVVGKAKKFSPNTAAEFFTRLRGKNFTLEWWGIKYGDPPEGGVMAGYAEQMEGRVMIAECGDRLDDWLAEL